MGFRMQSTWKLAGQQREAPLAYHVARTYLMHRAVYGDVMLQVHVKNCSREKDQGVRPQSVEEYFPENSAADAGSMQKRRNRDSRGNWDSELLTPLPYLWVCSGNVSRFQRPRLPYCASFRSVFRMKPSIHLDQIMMNYRT